MSVTRLLLRPRRWYSAIALAREYFYFLDHNGLLFLNEQAGRNWTSALRDRAFLEFFFRRIQRNLPPHRPSVSIAAQTFPFVSKCGVERNYLQTADSQLGRQATPIVFLEMVIASGDLVDGEQIVRFSLAGDVALIPPLHLRYAGGSLSVSFDPSALRSSADGSLYHLMPSDAPAGHADFGAGVCGSRLALQLGELISIDALSGRMSLRWAGRAIDIRPL